MSGNTTANSTVARKSFSYLRKQKRSLILAAAVAGIGLITGRAMAVSQDSTWTAAGDGTWFTASNWQGNTVPMYDAVNDPYNAAEARFLQATGRIVTVDGAASISALVFQGTGDWTINASGAGTLTLTGSNARYGVGQYYYDLTNGYNGAQAAIIGVGPARSTSGGMTPANDGTSFTLDANLIATTNLAKVGSGEMIIKSGRSINFATQPAGSPPYAFALSEGTLTVSDGAFLNDGARLLIGTDSTGNAQISGVQPAVLHYAGASNAAMTSLRVLRRDANAIIDVDGGATFSLTRRIQAGLGGTFDNPTDPNSNEQPYYDPSYPQSQNYVLIKRGAGTLELRPLNDGVDEATGQVPAGTTPTFDFVASSFYGNILIDDGTLKIHELRALGDGRNRVILNGGTLQVNNRQALSTENIWASTTDKYDQYEPVPTAQDPGGGATDGVTGGAIGNGKYRTFHIDAEGGTLDVQAFSLTLNDGVSFDAENQLQGTGVLTKTGPGTLILGDSRHDFTQNITTDAELGRATGKFSGSLVVSEGTVRLNHQNAAGGEWSSEDYTTATYTPHDITVGPNGTIASGVGVAVPNNISLAGKIGSAGGDRTFSGNITAQADLTFNSQDVERASVIRTETIDGKSVVHVVTSAEDASLRVDRITRLSGVFSDGGVARTFEVVGNVGNATGGLALTNFGNSINPGTRFNVRDGGGLMMATNGAGGSIPAASIVMHNAGATGYGPILGYLSDTSVTVQSPLKPADPAAGSWGYFAGSATGSAYDNTITINDSLNVAAGTYFTAGAHNGYTLKFSGPVNVASGGGLGAAGGTLLVDTAFTHGDVMNIGGGAGGIVKLNDPLQTSYAFNQLNVSGGTLGVAAGNTVTPASLSIANGGGVVLGLSGANGGKLVLNGNVTAGTGRIAADKERPSDSFDSAVPTLDLNGSRTFTVSGGNTLTVSAKIADTTGAGVLTKAGDGSMVISNANTFAGGMNIAGGVVVVDANAAALGTGSVTLGGGTLRLDPGYVSGLSERRYAGNVYTGAISGTDRITTGFRAAQTNATGGNPWADNTTYTYVGQFYLPDTDLAGDGIGHFAFAEHLDDKVRLYIDGTAVLNNDAHATPTWTGVLTGTAGWHNIELRVSNGTGGAGAKGTTENGATNWTTSMGVIFALAGADLSAFSPGLDASNYIVPDDPGDKSLFRFFDASTALTVTNTIVAQAGTASAIDVSRTSAGSTTRLNDLVVENGATLSFNRGAAGGSIAVTDTAFTGAPGQVVFGGNAVVNLGTVDPLANTVGTLTLKDTVDVKWTGELNTTDILAYSGHASGGAIRMSGTSITYAGTTDIARIDNAIDLGGKAVTVNVADVAGRSPELTLGTTTNGTIVKTGAGALTLVSDGGSVPAVAVNEGAFGIAGNNPVGAATVTLAAGTTLSLGRSEVREGLAETKYAAANFQGAITTIDGYHLEPRFANIFDSGTFTTGWAADTTFIYAGQIYIPDTDTVGDGIGHVAFGENIDDNVLLTVDDKVVLYNTSYNTPTSGKIELAAGWHDFELRVSNGSGNAGPTGGNANAAYHFGWTADKGFGWQFMPAGTDFAAWAPVTDGSAYTKTLDDGSGSTFRWVGPYAAATDVAGVDVVMSGNAAIDMSGAPLGTVTDLGTLAMPFGPASYVTVSGYGATARFTGTTLDIKGAVPNLAIGDGGSIRGDGSIDLGVISNMPTSFGTLTKTSRNDVLFQAPDITLTGGQISVTSGKVGGAGSSFILQGSNRKVTFTGGGATAQILNGISFQSADAVFDVADGGGNPDLIVSGPVTGANLIKNQGGSLRLDGRLALTGSNHLVNGGSLRITNDATGPDANSFGAGSKFTVATGASLVVQNAAITGTKVLLNGSTVEARGTQTETTSITADKIVTSFNSSFDGGTNTLTVTPLLGNQRGVSFLTDKVDVRAFEVSFVYNAARPDGGAMADGFVFMLQNDPRGTAAAGAGGGSLGYAGSAVDPAITPSVALGYNLYNGNGTTNPTLTTLATNGTLNWALTNANTNNTDPLNLRAGKGLADGRDFVFNIAYDSGTLTQTVTDTVTGDAFTRAYAIDIPAAVGDDFAYLGFSGATGGSWALQTISEFKYIVPAGDVDFGFDVDISGTGEVKTTAVATARFGKLNLIPDPANPSAGTTLTGTGSARNAVFTQTSIQRDAFNQPVPLKLDISGVSLNLGTIDPAKNTVTTLTKVGSGSLLFGGTLVADSIDLQGSGGINADPVLGATINLNPAAFSRSITVNLPAAATKPSLIQANINLGGGSVPVNVNDSASVYDVVLSGNITNGSIDKQNAGVLAFVGDGIGAGISAITVPSGGGGIALAGNNPLGDRDFTIAFSDNYGSSAAFYMGYGDTGLNSPRTNVTFPGAATIGMPTSPAGTTALAGTLTLTPGAYEYSPTEINVRSAGGVATFSRTALTQQGSLKFLGNGEANLGTFADATGNQLSKVFVAQDPVTKATPTIAFSGTLKANAVEMSAGTFGGEKLVINGFAPTIKAAYPESTPNLTGGIDLNNGTVTVDVDDNYTLGVDLRISGNLSNGNISKTGMGKLVLSGDNTHNQTIITSGNAVTVTSPGGLGEGEVVMQEGATLVFGSATRGLSATFWSLPGNPERTYVTPGDGNTDYNPRFGSYRMADYGLTSSYFAALDASTIVPEIYQTTGSDSAPVATLNFPNASNGAAFTSIGFADGTDYITRMAGSIFISEEADYKFQTLSDDGSVMFIDDDRDPATAMVAVSNNNEYHGIVAPAVAGATVHLAPGLYPVLIGMYQDDGGGALRVEYQKAGATTWTTISNDILFTEYEAPQALTRQADLNLPGTGNIDLTPLGAGSSLTMGELKPGYSSTLNVIGAGRTIGFTGTTFQPGANFKTTGDGDIHLGAITGKINAFDADATGRLSWSGDLEFSTFNLNAGSVVGTGALKFVGNSTFNKNTPGEANFGGRITAAAGTTNNNIYFQGVLRLSNTDLAAPSDLTGINLNVAPGTTLRLDGQDGTGGNPANNGLVVLNGGTVEAYGGDIQNGLKWSWFYGLPRNDSAGTAIPRWDLHNADLPENLLFQGRDEGNTLLFTGAINFNSDAEWTSATGGKAAFTDDYQNLFTGNLVVKERAVYQFRMNGTDDRTSFYIDVDHDGVVELSDRMMQFGTGAGSSPSILLEPGIYPIWLAHAEFGGGSKAQLQYSINGSAMTNVEPGNADQDLTWVQGTLVHLDFSTTDLHIDASSTLQLSGWSAKFGDLFFSNPGVTLTTKGIAGPLTFTGTGFEQSGSYTIDGPAPVYLGQVDDGDYPGGVTLNAPGHGGVVFNNNVTANNADGLMVLVGENGRVGAIAGAQDPIGGATISIGNNGTFALSGSGEGSNPVITSIVFTGQQGNLEHSGPYTDVLGDATHGISMPAGATLRIASSDGVLEARGPINATSAVVAAGTFGIGADGVVTNEIIARGGVIQVQPGVTHNGGTFRIDQGGSLTVLDGAVLAPASFTMAGGFVDIKGGANPGTLRPTGIIYPRSAGGPATLDGGGILDLSLGNVINVGDAAARFDMTISAQIASTTGLTKTGAGTLRLLGEQTFTGPIGVSDGAIAIADNANLGNAANVVNLSDGSALLGIATPGGGSIAGTRNIALGTGGGTIGALRYDYYPNVDTFRMDATITGNKSLRIGGDGIVEYGGTATVSDVTVLRNSTLALVPTSNFGAAPINVSRGGAVRVAVPGLNLSNVNLQPGSILQIDADLGVGPATILPTSMDRATINFTYGGISEGLTTNLTPTTPVVISDGTGEFYGSLNVTGGRGWLQINSSQEMYGNISTSDGSTLFRTGGSEFWGFNINGTTGYQGPIFFEGGRTELRDRAALLNAGAGSQAIVMGSVIDLNNVSDPGARMADVLRPSDPVTPGGRIDVPLTLWNGAELRLRGDTETNDVTDETFPTVNAYGYTHLQVTRGDNNDSEQYVDMRIPDFNINPGSLVRFASGNSASGQNLGTSTTGRAGRVFITEVNDVTLPLDTATIIPWAFVNSTEHFAINTDNGIARFTAMKQNFSAATAVTDVVEVRNNDPIAAAGKTVQAVKFGWQASGGLGGNITLNGNLTVTSGAVMTKITDDLRFKGTGKIVAGSVAAPTMMYFTTNVADNEPVYFDDTTGVIANGLTKGGNEYLVFNGGNNDFKGGNIYAVDGFTSFQGASTLGPATNGKNNSIDKFYIMTNSTGEGIDIRHTADLVLGNDVYVLGTGRLRTERRGSGNTYDFTFGNVYVNEGRTFSVENHYNTAAIFSSLTFGTHYDTNGANDKITGIGNTLEISRGGQVYDIAAINPNEFGTVTLAGDLTVNANASYNYTSYSKFGSLKGTGDLFKGGGGIIELTAPAGDANPHNAFVSAGVLKVSAQNALGGGRIEVYRAGVVDFGTAMTVYPKTVVDEYGGVANLQTATYSTVPGAAVDVILPERNLVIIDGSPALTGRLAGADWLGLTKVADTELTTIDPANTNFKGVFIGGYTGNEVRSSLESTSGDLNIYISQHRRFQPASATATQEFKSATGVVNIYGDQKFEYMSNGGKTITGYTVMNRYGEPTTQNNPILSPQGAGTIPDGVTVNIWNGKFRLEGSAGDTIARTAVINIWDGATYDSTANANFLTTGTVNVMPGGAAFINNTAHLTRGATFNFAQGSLLSINTEGDFSATWPTTANADIILPHADRDDFTKGGLLLGQGRRLGTSFNNSADISGGTAATNILGVLPGVTNIVMAAAPSRTLEINNDAALADVDVQVGDFDPLVTVVSDGDVSRRYVQHTGTVRFDGTASTMRDIDVQSGGLRVNDAAGDVFNARNLVHRSTTGETIFENGTANLSGDLTVEAGTVRVNGGTVVIAGDVVAQNGAQFLTSGGTTRFQGSYTGGSLRIGGAGRVEFDPGAGNTATLAERPQVGGTIAAASGTLDLASYRLGLDLGISPMTERFFKPDTPGIDVAGFGGDPFIVFENPTSFLSVTPGATGTLGAGEVLDMGGAVAAARAKNPDGTAYYPDNNSNTGVAYVGTLTVGTADMPAGDITFATRSDDGSTLYLDLNGDHVFTADEMIVQNLGSHGEQNRFGVRNLAAGTYDMAVGWFNGGGGTAIRVHLAPGVWSTNAVTGDFNALYPLSPTWSGSADVAAGATLLAGGLGLSSLNLNGSATDVATATLSDASGNSGTFRISVPAAGKAIFNLGAGNTVEATNVVVGAGGELTLNQGAGTTLAIGAMSGGTIKLGDGATVTLKDGAAPVTNAIEGLVLGAGAKLEIGRNAIQVAASDEAALNAAVVAGAIDSAALDDATDPLLALKTLAVMDTDAGLGTAALIKVTWKGESNGDGIVDGDDYAAIDYNFLAATANPLYSQGNYDYVGGIDGDDYFAIDSSFLGQNAVLAAGAADTGGLGNAAVPEPGTLGLLAIGALGLLARRRRNA